MESLLTTALIGLFLLSGPASSTPSMPPMHVAMTGYNAVPEQTDEDPFTTASGAFSDPDIVAARSVDLAEDLPFGTVIKVVPATSTPNCGASLVNDFIGLRVIADSMHPRKHNQIDIMFHADDYVRAGGKMVNPAIAFGVCKDVEIQVVGKIDTKNMPRSQQELAKMVGKVQLAVAK